MVILYADVLKTAFEPTPKNNVSKTNPSSTTAPNKTSSSLTRERLRPRTDALQILTARQALIRFEIGEEILQISGKVRLGAGSDEREDGSGAIGAFVELPRHAADGRRGDGRAARGDGPRAAEGREPDHDFVGVGAGGAAGGEHVVGDVGDDTGAGVTGVYCVISLGYVDVDFGCEMRTSNARWLGWMRWMRASCPCFGQGLRWRRT